MKAKLSFFLVFSILVLQCLSYCPPNLPVRCPNSQCVASVSNCPANTCAGSTPYLCSDGACAIDSAHCNCIGVLCVDGACKPQIQDCPILSSCPMDRPLRCPNGQCFEYNYDCSLSPAPVCDTGLIPCIDGICRTQQQCDNLPYNGCPVYQCPDGTCTEDFSVCLCGQSYVQCWDGSCVPLGTVCSVAPPAETSPMNVSTTVSSNETTVAKIPQSNNANSTAVTVTIPPTTTLETTAVSALPVAGSRVRKTQTVDPGGNTAAPKIVSTAVNVTMENGQTNFTTNVTLEFESNVSNATVTNPCVAVLEGDTWVCTNDSIATNNNGTLSASTTTRHFSVYAVIDAPQYVCNPTCPEGECDVEVYDLVTADLSLTVGWVEVKNKLAHEISFEFFTFEDRDDFAYGWQLNSLIIDVGREQYKNSFSERYREFVAIKMEDAFPPRGNIKCEDTISFFAAASVFDDGPCPPDRNENSCPKTYRSVYLVPQSKRRNAQESKSGVPFLGNKRNSVYPDVSNPGPFTYDHFMCCPCDYRAEKLADFGRECNGGANPAGCYLESQFTNCYPIGFKIGCDGKNTIYFDNPSALQAYLDRANQPALPLSKSHVNPASTESGRFGGHLAALALSDRLDRCDNDFAGSCNWLNSLYICPPEKPSDGFCSLFFGKTIKDILKDSNDYLGGCKVPVGFTYDQISKCLEFIGINLAGGRRPEELIHRGILTNPCS